MDTRIKNALGVVGTIAIALATIAVWNWAGATARSAQPGAVFSVTGNGKSVGVPDVAQFNFSILNEGGKAIASLQEDNTIKTNAAIDFLKSEGVDDKDIETQNYNINPRYQRYDCRQKILEIDTANSSSGADIAFAPIQSCPPPEIAGYTVRQTVQVKIRDFEKIGAIVAGVTERGANSVSGLNFTVDEPQALQGEARGKAIQDAKEQAQAMAKAGGFRLGRLVSVNEGGGYYPYARSFGVAESAAFDDAIAPAALPAPSIEPGSEEFNATVTLTYEIL